MRTGLIWFIAFLAGIVLVAGFVLRVATRRMDPMAGEPRCPECHYDMRGSVQLTCPECGMTVHREEELYWLVRKKPRRQFAEFLIGAGGLVLVVALLSLILSWM